MKQDEVKAEYAQIVKELWAEYDRAIAVARGCERKAAAAQYELDWKMGGPWEGD
jgi:hypothetical protein